jgi:hypothetical protein
VAEYYENPEIPVKIFVRGDRSRYKNYIGKAHQIVRKLREKLQLSDNPESGNIAPILYDGATFNASANYGIFTCLVDIPFQEVTEELKSCYRCPDGFPCFVFAEILEVVTDVAGDCYTTYNISFCLSGMYIELCNYSINAQGFSEYVAGQVVLLSIHSQDEPKCCINQDPLSEYLLVEESLNIKLIPGRLSVYPVHIFNDMYKKEPIEEECL